MKATTFVLLIGTYLKNTFYNEKVDPEKRLELLYSGSMATNVPNYMFHKTLDIIDFFSNRVEVGNEEELEVAYQMIFDFIATGMKRDYTGIVSVYRAFTTPVNNVNHANRKFFKCTDKINKILSK